MIYTPHRLAGEALHKLLRARQHTPYHASLESHSLREAHVETTPSMVLEARELPGCRWAYRVGSQATEMRL